MLLFKIIVGLAFLGWGFILFIPSTVMLSALVESGWLGFILTVLAYIGIGRLLTKL